MDRALAFDSLQPAGANAKSQRRCDYVGCGVLYTPIRATSRYHTPMCRWNAWAERKQKEWVEDFPNRRGFYGNWRRGHVHRPKNKPRAGKR